MKKEDFYKMMENLGKVRVYLKDEVIKNRETAEQLGNIQSFLEANIDLKKFEQGKNKKIDTRNVSITHEFSDGNTPFYCKTKLSPFAIYSLVYLVTYVYEALTPVYKTDFMVHVPNQDEVINILASLGFVEKAQCETNVEFDQIIDIAEMEDEDAVIIKAVKLLSLTQKKSLFEVVINERLTTYADDKEFCEELNKAKQAIANKNNSHTWGSIHIECVNYDMYTRFWTTIKNFTRKEKK